METQWPDHFQPEVVRDGFGGKLSSYTIALEAWRRGLQVTFLDPELRKYRIADNQGHSVTFIRSRPHMTTREGVRLANNKHETAKTIKAAGLPSPASHLVDTAEIDARGLADLAEGMGYPVVLKPLDGSMGRGVFAGISNSEELTARYTDLLTSWNPQYAVLEKHVAGADYRILVYGNSVIGACLRLPAHVTGDGQQTVQQLIDRKNRQRRKNPFLSKGLIKPDHEVEDLLRQQNMSASSIPENGKYVRLRSAANASAGGDVIDVTDSLPDEVKQTAIDAVRAVPGLFCAGVDILFDPNAESLEGSFTVLELNAHPQIGVNMYPTQGKGQDAPRRIIDICFPGSVRSGSKGDLKLSLPPLRPFLSPLQNGSAAEVTLARIPQHRFERRIICRIEREGLPTHRERNKLLLTARTEAVSGTLIAQKAELELVLAGAGENVSRFTVNAEEILDARATPLGRWDGPVAPGLHISER